MNRDSQAALKVAGYKWVRVLHYRCAAPYVFGGMVLAWSSQGASPAEAVGGGLPLFRGHPVPGFSPGFMPRGGRSLPSRQGLRFRAKRPVSDGPLGGFVVCVVTGGRCLTFPGRGGGRYGPLSSAAPWVRSLRGEAGGAASAPSAGWNRWWFRPPWPLDPRDRAPRPSARRAPCGMLGARVPPGA